MAVRKNPSLESSFDGFHWHVLLEIGSTSELNHGLIDSYLLVGLVKITELASAMCDHRTHFIPHTLVVGVNGYPRNGGTWRSLENNPVCDWCIVIVGVSLPVILECSLGAHTH